MKESLCLFLSGVIHGSWSCWSSWGSCTGGQKKRTRSCNNPAPRRGGLSCIGPQEEHRPCEEPEIQHLKYRCKNTLVCYTVAGHTQQKMSLNTSSWLSEILNDVVILSLIQTLESQFSHCELFVCRMMEPQCFSLSVTPPQKCGPPPNLRNGYVEVSLQNYFYYFSFHFFFFF